MSNARGDVLLFNIYQRYAGIICLPSAKVSTVVRQSVRLTLRSQLGLSRFLSVQGSLAHTYAAWMTLFCRRVSCSEFYAVGELRPPSDFSEQQTHLCC